MIAILVVNRRVQVVCYVLESVPFTWNYEEKCHFILYLTNVSHVSESTRAATLMSKCHLSLPRRLHDPALQTVQVAYFLRVFQTLQMAP